MMRINQFSNASMFQTQTTHMQGNNRAANQSFKTSLQNNSQAIHGMQRPDDLPEIPAGEEPPAKPDESDGGMNMPPSGMPGGFSGMNGMNSFNAMSFAMNMRQA